MRVGQEVVNTGRVDEVTANVTTLWVHLSNGLGRIMLHQGDGIECLACGFTSIRTATLILTSTPSPGRNLALGQACRQKLRRDGPDDHPDRRPIATTAAPPLTTRALSHSPRQRAAVPPISESPRAQSVYRADRRP